MQLKGIAVKKIPRALYQGSFQVLVAVCLMILEMCPIHIHAQVNTLHFNNFSMMIDVTKNYNNVKIELHVAW